MAEQLEYIILDDYKDREVYASKPPYARKEGGKFILNNSLSKKDLQFLYEVVKHQGIIQLGVKNTKASDKEEPAEDTKKK